VATFGHDIVAGLSVAANWIKSNWKNILGWLLFPVLMAAGEIYTHTHQIAEAFDDMRHLTAAILAGWRHDIASALDNVRHDIASAWDNIRHDVAAIVDAIPGDIAKGWDAARHLTAQALDNIRHDIASGFDSMRHDIASWIDGVLHYFEQLPGQIVNFLRSLPGAMLSIGQNIIHGLINGIESMGSTLASAIVSLIPSPIRSLVAGALGILSPSTVFHGYGVNLVQGLINGVQAMQPHLKTAMQGLTGGVTATGSSLAAGAIGAAGGAGANVHVTVNAQGTVGVNYADPRYQQALQSAVQEVTLRHAQLNSTNGLTPTWGRG
jgi:phage-related protein